MIYINGHENIVNLVGANTESLNKGVVYVFIEFCPLGSLEGFLRKHQNSFINQISEDGSIDTSHNGTTSSDIICTKELVLWSSQISSGTEYLAQKKVIHGDLATRNILLLSRECVKITDFGLAKKLYDYATYERMNKVPLPWRWRWIAPESLQNGTFSTKTDVWSFGVTLWEIFTLGNIPYPGLSWCPDFVTQLQFNMRMPQPKNASRDIYDLMRHCWEIEPNNRPSFTQIKEFFLNYLNKFLHPSEDTDLSVNG